MLRLTLPLLFLALVALSCHFGPSPIPPVEQSGELVVVTRNSPTTYYEDASGSPVGLEHDLAELFAREIGATVRFVVVKQFNEIVPTLEKRQAHLAAAGLTVTPEREKQVDFGPVYQKVRQQVAYNTTTFRPRSPRELVGKSIEVVAGSSYVERLADLKEKYPDLAWKEVQVLESEELLEKVANREVDHVVADSNIIALARNYHPNVGVAFDLTGPQPLAWAFPKEGDKRLLEKAQAFFARIEKDGTLKMLMERYYGHAKRLDPADVAGILEKSRTALHPLRKYFEQAQEQTDLDWRLIAAIAYHESHWDPLATSPTGVRGIMMLTAETADRLGVSDRLDPRQSILAGAKYIASLRDMLPNRIPEPDRTWMALAAYNMGYGHLEDGRILAQRLKLNPDSWADMKKVLPLLTQSGYYSTLKHGFARGGQAVILTESIRNYYDILVKFEKPYLPVLPMPKTPRLSRVRGAAGMS